MKPPPMIPRRLGSSSSRMIESDVWNPVWTRPSIGGIVGREPAAINTCGAVIVRACRSPPSRSLPSITNVLSPTKRAVPSISVRFGVPVARYSRPPAEIGSIRPKMRSRIIGQSAPLNWVSMPSFSDVSAARATSAGSTNIFDGMHPRLRHVPPNTSRSTRAIFQSSRNSGIELPDPLPMMIRSYCSLASAAAWDAGWSVTHASQSDGDQFLRRVAEPGVAASRLAGGTTNGRRVHAVQRWPRPLGRLRSGGCGLRRS